MSVIGVELETSQLVLTKHRDFKFSFDFKDESGAAQPFPAGELYFEIYQTPVLKWPFTISGSHASLTIQSEVVDKVPARTRWQLVWLPDGEAAGGDPLARGVVKIQE